MAHAVEPGSSEKHGHLWAMGAVSRATGIGEHTLRAWEKRFGFPRPLRLPSGHRRYTAEDVSRLRLIARALRRGHRAGEVVPLPPDELRELLGESADRAAETDAWLREAMESVRHRKRLELEMALQREVASLGAAGAMTERIAPLLEEVGAAWAAGDLSIGHEHFVSEAVEDVLRRARLSLEVGLTGSPVVLATLQGERHLLGLHMAALRVALSGRSLHILGADTPVDDIAAAARDLKAPAVAISISLHSTDGASAATRDQLELLRRRIPDGVRIFLGGSGAVSLRRIPDGVEVVPTLDAFAALIESLPEAVAW